MKLEKSRANFLEIVNIFEEIKRNNGTYNKTFNMFVLLNCQKLKSFTEEIQIFIEGTPNPEDTGKYLEKENGIINDYAELDNDGNIIRPSGPNSYSISRKHLEEFNSAKERLKEEYSKTLSEIEEITKTRKVYLDEKIEIEVQQIPFKYFPEDFDLTKQQILLDLITDFE